MNKKTTYAKLTAKIILTTLVLTLLGAFIYAEAMKDKAVYDLSKSDAKKTSMLIFESLYAAMAKGWTQDDMNKIIDRLHTIDKNMNVKLYRSTLVSELYGNTLKNRTAIEDSGNLQKAINGEEVLQIIDNHTIRFYYPVKAETDCLNCHHNAKQSDVLGALYISYPIDDLKVSLSTMKNFFFAFIIFFSLVIFLALFFKFNKYFIKPIKNFANNISSISQNTDLSQRVDANNNIHEIHSMQNVFNEMLDSIEFQFYNDSLTSLYNRKKLIEELDQKTNSTLMIINIDSFQQINDLYGNEIGDIVLKEYALLLKDTIQNDCSLYRLHADEFAILFTQHLDLTEIEKFALYITDTTAKHEFKIDEQTIISIDSTVGISYGEDLLLTNADIALKFAKKEKKKYLVYQSSMRAEHEYEQNIKWTKRIKHAIENDLIEPLFQPIVCCKTKEIVKYEALMRMKDENGDYIAPIHFLELAKKNKLYADLTKIVINKSFDKFIDNKHSVAINLSVEDILNIEIIDLIIKRLEETNIGNKITFELIESEGIENFEQVIVFIKKVKAYGCQIAIDDFGTGYSNFEYLMKLNVDFIKIDASMIKNIDVDANSLLVTETIIDFAKKMNIQTIAEFVHAKSISDKITEINIDYAQGYYFGAPQQI